MFPPNTDEGTAGYPGLVSAPEHAGATEAAVEKGGSGAEEAGTVELGGGFSLGGVGAEAISGSYVDIPEATASMVDCSRCRASWSVV